MAREKTKPIEVLEELELPEVAWEEITEAGAYVDLDSGDLYRIPQEGINGGAPFIHKESVGPSRLVQVSKNPFVTSSEARLSCARHNIKPHF